NAESLPLLRPDPGGDCPDVANRPAPHAHPPVRDLILRVWHVDPLRCPVCQNPPCALSPSLTPRGSWRESYATWASGTIHRPDRPRTACRFRSLRLISMFPSSICHCSPAASNGDIFIESRHNVSRPCASTRYSVIFGVSGLKGSRLRRLGSRTAFGTGMRMAPRSGQKRLL